MTDTTLPGAGLSRRGLLKVGLLGSAFLATAGVTASLSGCSASVPASGLATLRSSDLPFLRALILVVLAGAVLCGYAPALSQRLCLPVFDGVACAVQLVCARWALDGAG